MKAYRFRLAAVARIRAIEERVCRDRFVTAVRDLRRAREAERAAKVALAALEAPAGVVMMSDLLWTSDQAERLADAVLANHETAVLAEAASVAARRAWEAAAKRSGVLDRLDEHAFARWRDEFLQAEAAELDDLSAARHGWLGAGR